MVIKGPYLIFVIFLHRQNFWRIKFTLKKRVNYGKIHSKLPNFRVKSEKKFTPAKKNLHGYAPGARDKYQVCLIFTIFSQIHSLLC